MASFGTWESVIAVSAVLGAIMLIIILAQRRERRRREMLNRVAHELGGTVSEAPDGDSTIRFPMEGHAACLGRQQGDWIMAVVDLRDDSPGTMTIYPAGFWTPIARLLRGGDVKVGDARFDADFVTRANPPAIIEQVFTPEHRGELIEAIWNLGPDAAPRIDMTRKCLEVRARLPERQDTLLAAARVARLVLERIIHVEGLEILWVGEAEPGAQCQVCGTPLVEDIVQCARCRTIHHRDCWEYLGACSTFACHERRHV